MPVHITVTAGSSRAARVLRYAPVPDPVYSVGTVISGAAPLRVPRKPRWTRLRRSAWARATAAVPEPYAVRSRAQFQRLMSMSSSGTANARTPRSHSCRNLRVRAAMSAGEL
ncbi:hypothetical protein OG787_13465 [Streptomyces sp. NBC_00075]